MTSTLYRLLTYSKSTASEARENFTTEALADAIARDPWPFEVALRNEGILPAEGPPEKLAPYTQVHVGGTSFIDLVVRLGTATPTRELWFELKVDSGESGSQLAKYKSITDAIDERHRPTLIVLGPKDLGAPYKIKWLPWQNLWHILGTIPELAHPWTELRAFLEDVKMADAYNEPILPTEAMALEPARTLLRKVARLLVPVCSAADKSWEGASFPQTESEIRQTLSRQFSLYGRLTVRNLESMRASLVFGVGWMDENSWLTVRIEHNAKKGEERNKLLEQADAGGLPPSWSRHQTDSKAVRVDERLDSFSTQGDAAKWLIDRIGELRAAQMFTVIEQLGAPTPAEILGGVDPDPEA